jgi:general secretion pathway protein M
MSPAALFQQISSRIPYAAAVSYLALLLCLGLTTWGAVGDILERQSALASSADLLARLEGRATPRPNRDGIDEFSAAAGSPFLEGPTVTVAGAALLQRVGAAMTRYGGTVQSSQVDLQGSPSKPGFVSVVVSCEIEQPALQQLLYDLESGMPFIFVDQLVVQAPALAASATAGKLRVLLAASGQWEGEK